MYYLREHFNFFKLIVNVRAILFPCYDFDFPRGFFDQGSFEVFPSQKIVIIIKRTIIIVIKKKMMALIWKELDWFRLLYLVFLFRYVEVVDK